MPAIDFPSAPAVNDEYSFEGRTWLWNGTGWEVKSYPAALQLGSASAPSLYFTGDPNTGIYSPGANQVAISTNGTGRLFVDASGIIDHYGGIYRSYRAGGSALVNLGRHEGTISSPTAINSASILGEVFARGYDGTNYQRVASLLIGSEGAITSISAPGYVAFLTTPSGSVTNQERMRLDSSGRLGLGTSSPQTLLQLGNAAGTGGQATHKGTLQINSAPGSLTSEGGLEFKTSEFGSGYGWKIAGTVNGSTNPLLVGYRDNSATWSDALTITTAGKVGIGTTSPGSLLNLAHPTASDIRLTVAGTLIGNIYGSASDLNVHAVANVPLTFATNNAERARIDSSGRLLVGTSSAFGTGNLQVFASSNTGTYTNNAFSSNHVFIKSRSTTAGGFTVVQSGDELGGITFQGTDGSANVSGARIFAAVDGTPGTNDMPGRLVFSTTADGAASSTERMRITSAGNVGIANLIPLAPLDVGGEVRTTKFFHSRISSLLANTERGFRQNIDGTEYLAIYHNNSAAVFEVNAAERARIDSSGRLLVGTSTSTGDGSPLQVRSNGAAPIELFRSSDDSTPGLIIVNKSRGTTASPTVVTDGDRLGGFLFKGYSGAAGSYVEGARIQAFVDGEPDTSGDTTDMPTRLVFSTTADGASSTTEVLRLTNDRVIAYNQAAPATVDTSATITAANLKTGIITSSTAAAVTMTLPTGTDIEAGFSGIYTNMTFEFSVINTGPNTLTVGANGNTTVGSLTVATLTSARYALRRTGANTFTLYRLS